MLKRRQKPWLRPVTTPPLCLPSRSITNRWCPSPPFTLYLGAQPSLLFCKLVGASRGHPWRQQALPMYRGWMQGTLHVARRIGEACQRSLQRLSRQHRGRRRPWYWKWRILILTGYGQDREEGRHTHQAAQEEEDVVEMQKKRVARSDKLLFLEIDGV